MSDFHYSPLAIRTRHRLPPYRAVSSHQVYIRMPTEKKVRITAPGEATGCGILLAKGRICLIIPLPPRPLSESGLRGDKVLRL